MPRLKVAAMAASLIGLWLCSLPAAANPVDTELLLLVDISRSVDAGEYNQMVGSLAQSFESVGNKAFLTMVLSMQLIPFLAWCAGMGRRGAVTYPGMAQLTACVALLASVFLGVELFKNGDRVIARRLGEPLAPMQRVGAFEPKPEEKATDSDGALAAILGSEGKD